MAATTNKYRVCYSQTFQLCNNRVGKRPKIKIKAKKKKGGGGRETPPLLHTADTLGQGLNSRTLNFSCYLTKPSDNTGFGPDTNFGSSLSSIFS
jgi:hypothetical protein